MPLAIYKYSLPMRDEPAIGMPKGAHVLCVQAQRGVPFVWAIVDPEQPTETRTFRLFGTGHPMDIVVGSHHYIGTFQLYGGDFIGHLFEPEKR